MKRLKKDWLQKEPDVLTSFVDGVWLRPESRITVRHNPGRTTRVAARWSSASPAQARQAMDAADRAGADWAAVSPSRRCARLENFLRELEKKRTPFAAIITRENGKTRAESRAEIDAALADARYLLKQARAVLRRRASPDRGIHHEQILEPIGVTLLITPWNFPLATIVRKLVPALAYGNTIVIKPSELTPGPAVALVQLLAAVSFPSGTINLVLGTGRKVGPALAGHPVLRAISFTGSNPVGLGLAREIAGRDVRLQLEMGGKNSLVVLADADLDRAVEAAVTGGFSCAGQWCTGTGRVIVEDSVYSSFCKKLSHRASQLKIGPGDLQSTQVGPVITDERVGFARRSVRSALASGAQIACGGDRPVLRKEWRGHYFTPTVLTDVTEEMGVFREELFVPILPIAKAANEKDALRLANQGRFGLSASIFTSSPSKADRFTRGVEAGIVHQNLHTAHRIPALPVSAWRDSGRGTPECGDHGKDFYTRPRAVYINS